jgi:putative salt-induced outer membrane protein
MRNAVMLALFMLPTAALAAEGEKPFTMDANAAYVKSTGSSNKETIKGLLDMQYKADSWTHQFHAEGINEADNDTDQHTTERYLAFEKSSWNFTERDYLFIKPQWEKDLQSAFDYQAFLAAGYGRKVIKTDTMLLNTDFGVGVRRSKLDASGETKDDALGNFVLKYEWKFSKSARFNEDLSVETGSSGTVTRTRTAITADITDVLGLTLAYETKTDSGESEVQDSLTTFGLTYRLR